MPELDTKTIKQFRNVVWRQYKIHGRHDLPWRKTTDPYKILVSEIMLQQTQVARVIPKYKTFLKKFPTIQKLARASLHDVLSEWQGLGYNRRAKALKHAAEVVVEKYAGHIPETIHELVSLPGIGTYTASAVYVFAYNKPASCIETNIRTAYLHHFFSHQDNVHDKDIIGRIEATLDTEKPREWFWALMDYGAYLKKSGVKLNQKKVGYTKQSKFDGSDRQIRGAIIRMLTKKKINKNKEENATYTLETFQKEIGHEKVRVALQLIRLEKEGLVKKYMNAKNKWTLEEN